MTERRDPLSDALAKAERIDAPLRPKAQALFERIENAGFIKPELDVPYVVKHWLHAGTLSVLFGPPNVGKTFLALDLAQKVQAGLPWAKCRTRKTNVLYVAAEGGVAFRNRVAALDPRGFWVLAGPVNLSSLDHDAAPLAEALGRIERTQGPFGFIIVDTLARVLSGGDENAGPDITRLVASLDFLAKATGAHVMVIHHTGKDERLGLRGHSSLLAAIDTAISVKVDEYKNIIAEAVKQRDLPTGARFKYRLAEVELGTDAEGDPVTTRIVEPIE